MAKSRMFNHDDDFEAVQNEKQEESRQQEMKCPLEDTILRQTRLKERNNDLALEFRKLKPEIIRTHALLDTANSNASALAGTMINLMDLLKSSFPVRFSPEEKARLQHEFDEVAGKVIENVCKECNQAIDSMHRQEKRISLSPMCFWMLIAAIIILSLFFALVTFANIEIFHSSLLSRLIILFAVFICITFSFIAYAYYKYKQYIK